MRAVAESSKELQGAGGKRAVSEVVEESSESEQVDSSFLIGVASSLHLSIKDEPLVTRNPAYVYGQRRISIPPWAPGTQYSCGMTRGVCQNPYNRSLGTLPIFKYVYDAKMSKRKRKKVPPNNIPSLGEVRAGLPEGQEGESKLPDQQASGSQRMYYFPSGSTACFVMSVLPPSYKSSARSPADPRVKKFPDTIGEVSYMSSLFKRGKTGDNSQTKLPMRRPGGVKEPSLGAAPLLDLPSYNYEKKRTVLNHDARPYVTVIEYVSEAKKKELMNLNFKKTFPRCNITLTKLRSIKRKMHSSGLKCEIGEFAIGHALVYYERLTYFEYVNKTTRKSTAGACLLVAVKMFQDVSKQHLFKITQCLTSEFRVPVFNVFKQEFIVLYCIKCSTGVSDRILDKMIASVKGQARKK